MEEIINIIKEIKALESEHKKELEDRTMENIQDLQSNRVIYLKEQEKELLQELNETKDVYRKSVLNTEIDKIRLEQKKEIKAARAKRMRIRREKIKSLYKKLDENKLDEKKFDIKKNIETKKQLIDENKQEMYRIKANRDKLTDDKARIKPEFQNLYVEMTKQLLAKREQNVNLNKEIKEMNVMLESLENRDFDKILEEWEKEIPVEQIKSNKENKEAEEITDQENMAWNLKMQEEQKGIEYEEKIAWEAKERQEKEQEDILEEQTAEEIEEFDKEEQTEKEIDEVKKEEEKRKQEVIDWQREDQEGNYGAVNLYQSSIDVQETQNDEIQSKITIYPDTVQVNFSGYNYLLDLDYVSDEEKNTFNSLSKETLDKINDIQETVDGSIVKALLVNEKLLNDYLGLCELYNNKYEPNAEIENAIENYQLPTDFPEIEYNFQDLRKHKTITNEEKLRKYMQAKENKKMFDYMGMSERISIKASIIDKVYFEVKSFMTKMKNKMALPAPKDIAKIEDENTNNEDSKEHEEMTFKDSYKVTIKGDIPVETSKQKNGKEEPESKEIEQENEGRE